MSALKSKVRQATYTGKTWESPNGTVHYHTIEMEDNNIGEYGSLEINQSKFVVGQEREYEFIPSTNPNFMPKIKPHFAGILPGTNMASTLAQLPAPTKGFSTEKEAMISTIAVLKSSLESGQIKPADIKEFVIEFYPFFARYISHPPKVDTPEPQITEKEMGMPDNAMPF